MLGIQLLLVALVLVPTVSNAGYDPWEVRRGLESESELFGVKHWKLSDPGTAIIAETTMEGSLLTVSDTSSSLFEAFDLNNDTSIKATISRCFGLGLAATAAQSAKDIETLKQQLAAVYATEKSVSVINDVIFEIDFLPVSGNVFLFCNAKPVSI